MNITKEMIFTEFKDATKKDQSKKKETFTHRIIYLKTLKGDVPEDHKPSKVECLEHLELKVNEQIRQWESIRTRIKNYHNGLDK